MKYGKYAKYITSLASLVVALLLSTGLAEAQTVKVGALTSATTNCAVTDTCVSYTVRSSDTIANITLSGTFVGTITFEGSVGGTWAALYGTPWVGGSQVGSATATGGWTFSVAGKTGIRARMSAFTSGSATASIYSTDAASSSTSSGGGVSSTVDIAAGSAIIGKVGIDQTTPGTTNGVQITGATTTGSGTATGAVRVELPTNGTGVIGLNAGTAIVGKVGIDQTTDGTTNKVYVGNITTDVAVDAASSGNPVYVGAIYESTPTSVSASGDRTAVHTTIDQRTLTYNIPGLLVSGTITSAMTGTTSTSLVGATASNYLYITQCTVSNASTTVSTDMLLQDGNGGTTLYVLPAPAAAVATTGGGGGAFTFPTPLKVPTAGNALYVVNVTTGSSTKASCLGYRSTVSY